MKIKSHLIILSLIVLTLLSCSSSNSNSDPSQLTIEELLVQNSPWTFDHYELINIVDSGTSNVTQQEIENQNNQAVSGQVLTYNADGTGTTFIPNDGTYEWQWEIINNNQLKTTFSQDDIIIYDNFSVSTSELTTKIQDELEINANEVVIVYGKYIYK